MKDELAKFLGLTTRTVKAGEYAGKPVKIVIPCADYDTDIGPGAVGVGWDLALLGLPEHMQDPQVAKLAEGIDIE